MASAPSVKNVSTSVVLNIQTPFITGRKILAESTAGATVYGANDPGNSSAATYQLFRQPATGNYGFELSSSANTPQNTTGGALSVANQLRVVCIVNDSTILTRTRGDQDPAAGGFTVGAGGGTLVGDTTMVFHAAVAAGAVSSLIKSSGANTKTIIPGDKMTIVEGSLTETVTLTRQATANGTTQITVNHTPTTNAYTTAAVLTFVAASGKAIILGATNAPTVGGKVEVWILASSDVVTITGGALTAGRDYEIDVYKAMIADAATDLFIGV